MADTIKFKCNGCEKKIAVRAEYAGKKAKCPGCKQPIRVPSPRPKRSATGVPVGVGASPDDSSAGGASSISLQALAEMEARADAPLKELSSKGIRQPEGFRIEGGKDCPGCGSSLKPEAVICVHCGHDFESGEQLKTKRSKDRTPTPKAPPTLAGKAIKLLIVFGLIVLLGIAAWIGYGMFSG